MYCAKCGSQIDDNNVVCPVCGARVEANDGQKGKSRLPIITAIVALVAIAIMVILNLDRISNFCHKQFTSPEKYYQYVEKKSIEDFSSTSASIYNSLFLNNMTISDKSVDSTVSFEIGDGAKNYLSMAKAVGFDITWLENLSINTDTYLEDGIASINAIISANDTDIISGDFVIDFESGCLYMQLPDIADKYLSIDLNEYLSSDEITELQRFANIQDTYQDVINVCPTQSDVEQLVSKYLTLFVSSIEEVSKQNTTISVQEVSQKCTQLSYTIDRNELITITENILNEVKDDSEIEDIIKNMSKLSDTYDDEDEAYSEFIDEIDRALDELSSTNYADDELTITVDVYVNGKGEIVGRSIEYNDGKSRTKLVGSGTHKGSSISGDFAIKYGNPYGDDEYEIIDISVSDLDMNELKKGYINGNFEFTPCDDLSEINPSFSYLEEFKLNLTSAMTESTVDYKLGITYGIDDIGTITVSTKNGNSTSAMLPESDNTVNTSNIYELMYWLEDVSLTQVINNLKTAGVPQDWLDTLENINESLESGAWYNLLWQ